MNAPRAPDFPGMARPGTDFAAVRDGRRAVPFYLPVDLSVARSIAAGTALIVPIAGNSFYSDPLIDASGLPIGGVAKVHFQDVNLNPSGTPFTVSPQFIARVPFTQLLIENPAQAGKFANFIYGVDIDFTPGINAQVTISGVVAVAPNPDAYANSFQSNTVLTANVPENIVAAGANLSGINVWAAHAQGGNGAGFYSLSLLCKATAPASIIDGDVIAMTRNAAVSAVPIFVAYAGLEQPLKTLSGKRLDWIGSVTESTLAFRHCLYTLA